MTTVLRRVVVVIVVLACLGPHVARAQTSVPRFDAAPCPFKPARGISEGKNLRCGYLVVPENRSAANGRTIKLAVAIYKSPLAHPAPDPVVFLQGGPGAGALGIAPFIDASSLLTWTGDRDLILIDQRGTGYSQPSLACPEDTKVQVDELTMRWSKAQERAKEAAATAACRRRLVRAGVDLSAYNTPSNAADIADLRVALGYSSVNLYGGSYGTRLALAVMRDFPRGIRSVVLDAVLPPTVNVVSAPATSAARDFNHLFAACKKAQSCNTKNPNLRNVFVRLVQQLDKTPPTIMVKQPGGTSKRLVLTGENFVGVLFQAFYANTLISALPDMITGAAHGRYGLTAQIASELDLYNVDNLNLGMYLSVECSEDAPFVTDHAIDVAARALPANTRADFAAAQHRELHNCRVWNVKSIGAGERQPVTSSIPTMVMVGEYDPITPPPYAAEVARTLSHSFLFVYPGLGHGTRYADACPNNMVSAFLDDPTRKPDAGCIATMGEPF